MFVLFTMQSDICSQLLFLIVETLRRSHISLPFNCYGYHLTFLALFISASHVSYVYFVLVM